MADRTILQPINVREMWEQVVADLASDGIDPPHEGITSEEIALMLLIRYSWDLDAINKARDDSDFQEICDAIGVSRTADRVTLCLGCLEDEKMFVMGNGFVKAGAPDYAKKIEDIAIGRMTFYGIPGCGHYCATHYRYDISHRITVYGTLELKCKHHGCSTNYPMSFIPSDYVPPYQDDNLLEIYKKSVDDNFFYYLEGRVSCQRCKARFSAPSPGTYTCGKCSKPVTRE